MGGLYEGERSLEAPFMNKLSRSRLKSTEDYAAPCNNGTF